MSIIWKIVIILAGLYTLLALGIGLIYNADPRGLGNSVGMVWVLAIMAGIILNPLYKYLKSDRD